MPLSALESTLKLWLREQLPLPEEVGDISFDAPEGTWGASISRPTLNLFLFDISRAARQPVISAAYREADGTIVRDRPAPVVSFSYLLSSWGGGVREEHRLLGDAVRAVLRAPTLAGPATDSEIAGPVEVTMSEPEQVRGRDLWAGLGGRLRPSLVIVATTGVLLDVPQRVAPPVQRVQAEVLLPHGEPPSPDRVEASSAKRFVWLAASRQRQREQD